MGLATVVLQPPLDKGIDSAVKGIQIEAKTVAEALVKLCEQFPGLNKYLWVGNQFSPSVQIFHNSELLRYEFWDSQAIGTDDEICLLTSIQGG